MRHDTIAGRSRLRIDGRENGGIEIIGSDRNNIIVVSKIQAQAESQRDAKELAESIRVEIGDDIRADGPSTRWRSSPKWILEGCDACDLRGHRGVHL